VPSTQLNPPLGRVCARLPTALPSLPSSPHPRPAPLNNHQMEGCSFFPSRFSGAGAGGETGRLLRSGQRGLRGRRLSDSDAATVMGLRVDQGLLLILISAGLVLLMLGLCCLDRWMRRHPDVPVDHLLMPKRYRSKRIRRVHQVGAPSPYFFQQARRPSDLRCVSFQNSRLPPRFDLPPWDAFITTYIFPTIFSTSNQLHAMRFYLPSNGRTPCLLAF